MRFRVGSGWPSSHQSLAPLPKAVKGAPSPPRERNLLPPEEDPHVVVRAGLGDPFLVRTRAARPGVAFRRSSVRPPSRKLLMPLLVKVVDAHPPPFVTGGVRRIPSALVGMVAPPPPSNSLRKSRRKENSPPPHFPSDLDPRKSRGELDVKPPPDMCPRRGTRVPSDILAREPAVRKSGAVANVVVAVVGAIPTSVSERATSDARRMPSPLGHPPRHSIAPPLTTQVRRPKSRKEDSPRVRPTSWSSDAGGIVVPDAARRNAGNFP